MVAVFFTLRFGWNLSGLVVPGYMTPLLLIKPLSATVVFIEGVMTYWLVYTFSERCSRWGLWSSLFGRDRFFGLVLTSVAVRLASEHWLWPLVGDLLNAYFRMDFDYRSDLHSFGLIVVALIANQFWKTGVRRGWVTVFVTTSLTFLIVRYGLMEFTNFSIGNLSYAYDNLAASLLATPKAYIVLLTTAFLASRMNLYYGWEFNGILIPSLLALQWYQPLKILTSFGEAFLILGMARLLFKIPAIAALHLEGPRELLFFFNLGFGYKLALGWLLPLLWPTAPIMDIYGFGYLLTTLMAMRIYDKEIAARLTRATLQTSLVAVGVASLAGFSLTLLPEPSPWSPPTVTVDGVERVSAQSLSDWLDDDRVELQRSRLRAGTPTPLLAESAAFKTGLQQLRAYLGGDPAALKRASTQLAVAGYRIYQLEQRYLYLREQTPARGWGFYVLDLRASSNLVIEIPAPLDERNVLAAGKPLFEILGARALAVAGTSRAINPDGSLDVLRNRQTFFHIFHQVIARRDVLQVRGYTPSSSEILTGTPAEAFRAGTALPPTALWVRARLPPGLDLARLRGLVGELQVHWGRTPLANLQRDDTTAGFAELILNRPSLRQLLARALTARDQTKATLQVGDLRIDGYLRQWLLADKRNLAERGTDLYHSPPLEALLYLDEDVVTPLLKLLRDHPTGEWSAVELAELQTLATAAHVFGYRLLRYRHRPSGQEHLLLVEEEASERRRYWGTYVFRVGESSHYTIAVSRPLFETNTFEYGVSLYEQSKASVLLLAGAHPQANRDGSADVSAAANPASIFTLIHQIVLRETADMPWLTISVRAYGLQPGKPTPNADVLLAWDSGIRQQAALSPLGRGLWEILQDSNLRLRFVDGGVDTAGYDASGTPQTRYLSAALNKEFCTLWLSPLLRAAFGQQNDNLAQTAQFEALGIATRTTDLYQYLTSLPVARSDILLPKAWSETVRAYLDRRDIINLRQLRDWPGFRYQRVLDNDTQQAFLVVLDTAGRLRLAINLTPRQPDSRMTVRLPLELDQIEQFKNNRTGWLLLDRS